MEGGEEGREGGGKGVMKRGRETKRERGREKILMLTKPSIMGALPFLVH